MKWLAIARTLLCICILSFVPASAQQVDVDAQVNIRSTEPGDIVVWLEPIAVPAPVSLPVNNTKYRLIQRDHQFIPHLLVVPVGSAV